MPSRDALLRGALVLAPPVALLALARILTNEDTEALLISAAVIYLAVVAFEATITRQAPSVDGASNEVSASAFRRQTRRLLKLLSFIGTSTPTLAGAAAEGDRETLDGWLDLVSQRLETAVGYSAGAMVLREEWVVDDDDLVPFCEVASSGGSPHCVRPRGARIRIKAGIAWDVGQSVGARSIFLSAVSIGDHRFWVCLTLVAEFEDPLLQPITSAMVAPVTLMALTWVREDEEPQSSSLQLNPRSDQVDPRSGRQQN